MTTYLVTGAAGFIGSQVATILLNLGNKVIGLDNLNSLYDIRLKNYRLKQLIKQKRFVFYKVNVENKDKLKKIFKKEKIRGILNLAAKTGVRYSVKNPQIYLTTNVKGTLNLLEMMIQFKVKKMVLASTSSIYSGQKMPFSENLPVNQPISPYAASKKAAEMIAYTYHYLHELDITIVRYFTVFGPCGRPDMSIFRFIKLIDEEKPIELFGNGNQSRDFTFIDDVAQGTVDALKEVGYEIINIGGGKNPVTINAIINLIERKLNKAAKVKKKQPHKADIISTWADISKASKILKWKPVISVNEGIQRTIDWHVENRCWLKDIIL